MVEKMRKREKDIRKITRLFFSKRLDNKHSACHLPSLDERTLNPRGLNLVSKTGNLDCIPFQSFMGMKLV